MLFGDRFAACDGKPLETLPDDGIEDLGSRAGVERVNALLEPLRSAISFGGRA
ncbi:hypothetical protein [Streptomyces sp. NPDC054854]